jgi:glycosyltransferase involved in cell wall biosynthesis
MHHAREGEPTGIDQDDGVVLHPVVEQGGAPAVERHTVSRRLTTAWYAAMHGDRSHRWARIARSRLPVLNDSPPTLVIGCFTPRGPISVARAAAHRWGVPWIADLQDPSLEGCSRLIRPLVARWMRRTLRTAAAVVQVSPEWARADAALLGRPVAAIRHAVPGRATHQTRRSHRGGDFTLLYAGSLIGEHQSPAALLEALDRFNARPGRRIVLEIAGGDSTWKAFERLARQQSPDGWLRRLGWLSPAELSAAFERADCLVLIPSNEPGRPVVPSKLFEYMAYDRPILIAGPDAGGLDSLYAEWGHPDATRAAADAIADALEHAVNGDESALLRRSACAHTPLDEDALIDRYMTLISGAAARHPSHTA